VGTLQPIIGCLESPLLELRIGLIASNSERVCIYEWIANFGERFAYLRKRVRNIAHAMAPVPPPDRTEDFDPAVYGWLWDDNVQMASVHVLMDRVHDLLAATVATNRTPVYIANDPALFDDACCEVAGQALPRLEPFYVGSRVMSCVSWIIWLQQNLTSLVAEVHLIQHCVEICFLGRVLGGRIVAEYDIKFSNLLVAVLPDFFARCSTLHQTSAAENGVHQLERFQMVGDTHGQHVHEASAM
jgi:hypothetical protein